MRTTTPEEWARRANGFAGGLQETQRKAVGAAAFAAKKEIATEVRKVVGADMRLTGVGKRGAKLSVYYNVVGYKNPTATIAMRGPVHLVERPTKPHRVPRVRKRGRKRVVVIPGVGVRASANHPGTHGQYPFKKGTERGKPKAVAAFNDTIVREFRGTFG